LSGVAGILPLSRGLTHSPSTFLNQVVVLHSLLAVVAVHDAVHGVVSLGVGHVIVHTETRSSACTATLTLVVPGQCIATGELATTFIASVRSLTGMKLSVPFQVV
jgi:hypothetical protein